MSKYRRLLLAHYPLDRETPCGYCRFPFGHSVGQRSFEVDHIKPKSRFRELSEEIANLTWACVQCNGAKSDHIDGLDPETWQSFPLFNPNKEHWKSHFSGQPDGKIRGLTATGRATSRRLKLNLESILLELRADGYAAGWWPA